MILGEKDALHEEKAVPEKKSFPTKEVVLEKKVRTYEIVTPSMGNLVVKVI